MGLLGGWEGYWAIYRIRENAEQQTSGAPRTTSSGVGNGRRAISGMGARIKQPQPMSLCFRFSGERACWVLQEAILPACDHGVGALDRQSHHYGRSEQNQTTRTRNGGKGTDQAKARDIHPLRLAEAWGPAGRRAQSSLGKRKASQKEHWRRGGGSGDEGGPRQAQDGGSMLE